MLEILHPNNKWRVLRNINFLFIGCALPGSVLAQNTSDDVDAIERIEVIRGGTAAYGFGAGGLINIITNTAQDEME
ncbi:TonB-dependent receptor [Nitrosococcus halophilus Nc 4]|uniref:TonB-dependent receptor n=1 Tax=Nitrosococcus halophilus (strain Nc4) TaxID=472759 RepID=D5C312_NITHN|nr:TonB-dependent receptor [Nitrosococcus halophilus]ADE14904.1 TonB-dependent receptor [Nitrosococcus halophilus Nc 4]